ncbi:hypothetical protein KKB99_08535 [bacterium]|nr:hypothetical protein [bacterium]MBU1026038.1 hypothetical protein [bacterium]
MHLAYELRKLLLTIIFVIMLSPSLFAELGKLEIGDNCEFQLYSPELNKLFFTCESSSDMCDNLSYDLISVDAWTLEIEEICEIWGSVDEMMVVKGGKEVCLMMTNHLFPPEGYRGESRLQRIDIQTGEIVEEINYGLDTQTITLMNPLGNYIATTRTIDVMIPPMDDTKEAVEKLDEVYEIVRADDFSNRYFVDDYLFQVNWIDYYRLNGKLYFSDLVEHLVSGDLFEDSDNSLLYVSDSDKLFSFNPSLTTIEDLKSEFEKTTIDSIKSDFQHLEFFPRIDQNLILSASNYGGLEHQFYLIDTKDDQIIESYSINWPDEYFYWLVHDSEKDKFFSFVQVQSDVTETKHVFQDKYIFLDKLIELDPKNSTKRHYDLPFSNLNKYEFKKMEIVSGKDKSRVFFILYEKTSAGYIDKCYYMDIE